MEQSRLNRTVPAVKSRYLVAASAIALFFLLLLLAGPQRADASSVPFKIDFDDSTIDVNVLKDLPLDTLASDSSIEGKLYDNGHVTIPKGNFKMPELGITTPVAVRGFMGIESDAFGTYDSATGKLELDAEAGIWVSVDIQQAMSLLSGLGIDLSSLGSITGFLGDDLTCGFGPMDVHFTTEGTSLAEPGRFTKGPLGTGSLSAEWSKLGPFSGQTKILGVDACSTILALAPGLIEGLGGDALGGLDLSGILEGIDLNNVDLGPSGITLIRSVDENTTPDPDPDATSPKLKLKISPRSRKANAGKTIKYRATVMNRGTGAADGVSVCVKAPKKAVKALKTCRNFGSIAADGLKFRTFKVRVKPGVRRKSVKLTFRTKTSAKTKPKNTASLRVR